MFERYKKGCCEIIDTNLCYQKGPDGIGKCGQVSNFHPSLFTIFILPYSPVIETPFLKTLIIYFIYKFKIIFSFTIYLNIYINIIYLKIRFLT